MTQSLPRLFESSSTIRLDVQLRSLKPIEALDTMPPALQGSETLQVVTNTLLLHPGEPGEISVRLQNLGDRPLRFHIELETNLPGAVFFSQFDLNQLSERRLQELATRQTEELGIGITVPIDFFEQQHALTVNNPTLKLEYQLQIYVYQEIESEVKVVRYRVFDLYVRPRTTYLDFLPDFYREIDFTERLLAIFEQAFDPYTQTIDSLWAYLDPLTAPESLLPFLAYWVAWRLEPDWELDDQRKLIRHAMELYRWHGTCRGLALYLHLYTGLPLDEDHIHIEEVFGNGFKFGDCQMGMGSLIGGGRPYHFVVRLQHPPGYSLDEARIRAVIAREKPPFCTYDLNIGVLPGQAASR